MIGLVDALEKSEKDADVVCRRVSLVVTRSKELDVGILVVSSGTVSVVGVAVSDCSKDERVWLRVDVVDGSTNVEDDCVALSAAGVIVEDVKSKL